MHILITGATGFLGSQTTDILSSYDAVSRITATGRTLREDSKCSSPKVSYTLGELSIKDFVRSLFKDKIDVVINCASKSSPWGSYDSFYQSNVVTQEHLIEFATKNNVSRFIYIGTPSIYFDYTDRLDIKEDDYIPKPLVNHYATTKLAAEQLLKDSGLTYITLRPRALTGAGDTVIMPRLIRSHNEGRLRIMGTGNNVADLTPVKNFVDAIWLAINTSTNNCNTDYNISNGNGEKLWPNIQLVLNRIGMKAIGKKSPYWLLYAVAWIMENRARLTKGKEPILTRYSVGILAKSFTFDITKAREMLGYIPKQTTQEAIEDFATWYTENNRK